MRITLKEVKANPKVHLLIQKADDNLAALGYTEHGFRHLSVVARWAGMILRELKFPERKAELAEIAGYLHDIGNVFNRDHHAQTGAILAYEILTEMGMSLDEVVEVVRAIGNHHEEDGFPVSEIAAALILADKADVHRSRVRPIGDIRQDIHDRVNYAATNSEIQVDPERRVVQYRIEIDTAIAPVMEYFQIFLSRMLIASKAARVLGCEYELYVNGVKMS